MTIDEELTEHIEAIRGTVAAAAGVVGQVSERLIASFEEGGKLLLCGNGGSAADAQHLAAEFINRLRVDRSALPAIALTVDTSVLTCIGNDASFDRVFARQVEAIGRAGDVLFAYSTSGGSANVLHALRTARDRGLVTVSFTSEHGAARMAADSDHVVAVPSRDTARIQECHEFVGHVIAGRVERWLLEQEGAGTSGTAQSGLGAGR